MKKIILILLLLIASNNAFALNSCGGSATGGVKGWGETSWDACAALATALGYASSYEHNNSCWLDDPVKGGWSGLGCRTEDPGCAAGETFNLVTQQCETPVDCTQNTTTEYYTGTGAAPASVCDGGCQYINGAAHSTGGNWGGWYTGSGLNCQAGDGTGTVTDPSPNATCGDTQFPLTIDGAPGVCLPDPESPLTDEGCFEFDGERVCANDGDPACSLWEKAGQVCPTDNKNCVMKGGRIVCPSQPPGENVPTEEGETCVTVGADKICFKDGKYQESMDTSVTNNPDGSTTTTETSSSNVAGTGSTTTTTVVNQDGSSTTTTEKEPTSTDQDADGTPDEAGKGTASGGHDCTAHPTCDGDPIACAQLRQQWEQRCEAKKLNDALGVGEEIDQSLFDYQGTTGEALSEHGLLTEETGLFDDVRATVDGGTFGSCPADITVSTSMLGSIDLGSQPLCDFIDIIRPFILAINALFVILWFVRVSF